MQYGRVWRVLLTTDWKQLPLKMVCTLKLVVLFLSLSLSDLRLPLNAVTSIRGGGGGGGGGVVGVMYTPVQLYSGKYGSLWYT